MADGTLVRTKSKIMDLFP